MCVLRSNNFTFSTAGRDSFVSKVVVYVVVVVVIKFPLFFLFVTVSYISELSLSEPREICCLLYQL